MSANSGASSDAPHDPRRRQNQSRRPDSSRPQNGASDQPQSRKQQSASQSNRPSSTESVRQVFHAAPSALNPNSSLVIQLAPSAVLLSVDGPSTTVASHQATASSSTSSSPDPSVAAMVPSKRRQRNNHRRDNKKPHSAGHQGAHDADGKEEAVDAMVEDPPQQQQQQRQPRLQQQQRQPKSQHTPRQQQQQEEQVDHEESAEASSSTAFPASSSKVVTAHTFRSLGLHQLNLKALHEEFKYECMTEVQAQSIPVSLTGIDVLAKAKTGSGKTLAFLIPAIENVLRQPKAAGANIRILVISPTRELAAQIGVEAEKLCSFNGMKVEVIFGGTNMNGEVRRLQNGVDILVATPGRLIDHLQSGQARVADQLQSLRVLVLDEADRLLDMGFRPALNTIFSFLPKIQAQAAASSTPQRQTLLFSATLPDGVQQIVKQTLRAGFKFVNTVAEDDEQTVHQVQQQVCVTPIQTQLETCVAIVANHVAEQQATPGGKAKVMMFFTTARLTQFVAALFQHERVRAVLSGQKASSSSSSSKGANKMLPIWEIHSRKSQSFRTRAADEFRAAEEGVLLSSDVSARGVDYPGVTLVVQIGLTDRESYIHRLGRTARAGTSGQGVLLLADFEAPGMMKDIADLPITPMAQAPTLPASSPNGENAVSYVLNHVVPSSEDLSREAEMAWQSWLGFYNSHLRLLRWDKPQLVEHANAYAPMLGLAEPPALQKQTIGKMGLKGVPGLRVESDGGQRQHHHHQGHGGGRGGGRQPQQQQQQGGQGQGQGRQQVRQQGRQQGHHQGGRGGGGGRGGHQQQQQQQQQQRQ